MYRGVAGNELCVSSSGWYILYTIPIYLRIAISHTHLARRGAFIIQAPRHVYIGTSIYMYNIIIYTYNNNTNAIQHNTVSNIMRRVRAKHHITVGTMCMMYKGGSGKLQNLFLEILFLKTPGGLQVHYNIDVCTIRLNHQNNNYNNYVHTVITFVVDNI